MASLVKYLYLPLALSGVYMFTSSSESVKLGVWIHDIHAAGVFPHGVPHRRVYTGYSPIDLPLQFLVAFFLEYTDGSHVDSQMFSIYFILNSLLPILVVMQIEAERKKNKGTAVGYVLPWSVTMQGLGFCFSIPLYFFFQRFLRPSSSDSSIPVHRARALLPGLLLGAVLPSIAIFLPGSYITPHTRQGLIGFWQFIPVWFCLSQNLFAFLFPAREKPGADLPALYSVYGFLTFFSLVVHAYVASYILDAADPWQTARNVFVPAAWGSSTSLAQTAVTLLRWDFILGVGAAVVWTYMNVWAAVKQKSAGKAVGLAVLFTVGSVAVGPGFMIPAGFRWREEKLRDGPVEEDGKREQ